MHLISRQSVPPRFISKNRNTELFAIRACVPNFGGPHSANQIFNFAPPSWEMRSIVARVVNFGMAVAYMFSAEQRAIETVASMDVSHSDICVNTHTLLFAFCSTELVVRLGVPLGRC